MSTWSRTSKIYSQNLWGIHKGTETDCEQREALPSISIATKCLLVYFSNHELQNKTNSHMCHIFLFALTKNSL